MVRRRESRHSISSYTLPGHWEGDLLSGSKNSYIAALVERHSRYVTLAKVGNKDTQTVVSALIKQAKDASKRAVQVADLEPRQGTCGSSTIDIGD